MPLSLTKLVSRYSSRIGEMGIGFGKVEDHIWGHKTFPITPYDIVERVKEETRCGIGKFNVLPEWEPCDDRPEYGRVSVNIPLSRKLYDQLMNGSSGYRAQYFLGIKNGEKFNRLLVNSIAPIIVGSESLYNNEKLDRDICKKSLCGKFSKFWFSKEITDLSEQDYLCKLPEVISIERWKNYWGYKAKPWKGLLAPIPESRCVLLNGTFIDPSSGKVYEQKPTRSQQLHASGWT